MNYGSIKFAQKGFSLVELMVAMVLGLMIVSAAVQLFLTNRQNFNLQQGVASVQEQGRFTVNFLSKEIMAAGGIEFSNEGGGTPNGADHSKFDDLVISYEGRDCSGAANSAGWKRYSVDDNALTCRNGVDGSSAITQTVRLVDNVESFQVLYGVDTDDDSYANKYVTLTGLGIVDNIVSVRYGIVISSDAPAAREETYGERSLEVLDQTYSNGDNAATQFDFTDGRLRRVFVSTVALRNI